MPHHGFAPLDAASCVPDRVAASIAGAVRYGNRGFLSGPNAVRADGSVACLAGVTDVVLRHRGPVAPCLSTVIIKGLAGADLAMEVDITAMVQGDYT